MSASFYSADQKQKASQTSIVFEIWNFNENSPGAISLPYISLEVVLRFSFCADLRIF